MTTTTSEIELQGQAEARQQRLSVAMHQLRTRASAADPGRVLLIAGGIMAPLGLAFILMGWWGAAHTARLFEQIPYAISGGMLGLALVFGGAFAYFAYWLTQLVHAVRQDASRTGATLERIEELLSIMAASAETNGAARGGRSTPLRSGSRPATSFVATAHGTMFHRPDCSAVDGQPRVRRVTGNEKGLAPCKICEPLSD